MQLNNIPLCREEDLPAHPNATWKGAQPEYDIVDHLLNIPLTNSQGSLQNLLPGAVFDFRWHFGICTRWIITSQLEPQPLNIMLELYVMADRLEVLAFRLTVTDSLTSDCFMPGFAVPDVSSPAQMMHNISKLLLLYILLLRIPSSLGTENTNSSPVVMRNAGRVECGDMLSYHCDAIFEQERLSALIDDLVQ